MMKVFCETNYTLVGNEHAFCDGKNWDRTIGTCQLTNLEPETYCDFDSKSLCGWVQDKTHNIDWKWINRNIYNVGPHHDHTKMKPLEGFFLVMHGINSNYPLSARLISPIYDSKLSEEACLRFYYHMFGRKTGTIRIYLKPNSVTLDDMLDNEDLRIFEIKNTSKNVWREAVAMFNKTAEDFQVKLNDLSTKILY